MRLKVKASRLLLRFTQGVDQDIINLYNRNSSKATNEKTKLFCGLKIFWIEYEKIYSLVSCSDND